MMRRATSWTAIGVAVGAVLGLAIGGIGIAAMGDATGISAVLTPFLLGAVGALLGYLLGRVSDLKRRG